MLFCCAVEAEVPTERSVAPGAINAAARWQRSAAARDTATATSAHKASLFDADFSSSCMVLHGLALSLPCVQATHPQTRVLFKAGVG